MDDPSSGRTGVRSVEKGAQVLKAISASGRPMTLSDIASAAGMPASQAHRYLVSLINAGLVKQEAATSRYDLGPGAIQLGLTALGRLDPFDVVRDAVADISQQCAQTTFAATWAPSGPTVFAWKDAPRPVSVNVRVGNVLPIPNSATGLVFATWHPEAINLATRKVTDPVRARGFARVQGTFQPGIHALSAPVFDYLGQLVAAITILGIRGEIDDRLSGDSATTLRQACQSASVKLGYSSTARGSSAQQSA